jgi:hypothetical protein
MQPLQVVEIIRQIAVFLLACTFKSQHTPAPVANAQQKIIIKFNCHQSHNFSHIFKRSKTFGVQLLTALGKQNIRL